MKSANEEVKIKSLFTLCDIDKKDSLEKLPARCITLSKAQCARWQCFPRYGCNACTWIPFQHTGKIVTIYRRITIFTKTLYSIGLPVIIIYSRSHASDATEDYSLIHHTTNSCLPWCVLGYEEKWIIWNQIERCHKLIPLLEWLIICYALLVQPRWLPRSTSSNIVVHEHSGNWNSHDNKERKSILA